MKPDYGAHLAEFAATLRYDDIPETALKHAIRILVDTVGCTLGGQAVGRRLPGHPDPAAAVLDAICDIGAGGVASVLGTEVRTSVPLAAFANAFLGEMLDFEDSLVSHPSVAAVPAGLAVAEAQGASGRDLIAAIVAGYEVGVRVGRAMAPTPRRGRVVPSQWTWQGFVAAATAGRLLSLTPANMLDAFGYVGTASPVPVAMYDGPRPLPWSKTSFAEQTYVGVFGAYLARRGYRGARHTLDSSSGFWRMAGSDRYRSSELLDGLGSKWLVADARFKAYPACRMAHTSFEAASELRRLGVSPDNVGLVEVLTNHEAAKGLSDPNPNTVIDATFSLPFVVAMGLSGVDPDLSWFTPPAFDSPSNRSLMRKVTVFGDDAHDRRYAEDRTYSATLRVTDLNGSTQAVTRIDPTTLSTDEEVDAKFRGMAEQAIGPKSATKALENLRRMDSQTDVAGLVSRSFL